MEEGWLPEGWIGTPNSDAEAADVAARLWAESGAQWLTDPNLGVPVGLVQRVVSAVQRLDRLGARLGDDVPAAGLGLLAERAAALDLPRSSTISCGGGTRLIRTADGWVALNLSRRCDVEMLPALLAVAIEDDAGVEQVPWEMVIDAARRSTTGGLVDRAGLLGLACSALDEQTDASPVRAQRVGDAAPTSLKGLMVLNLGSLWAAPLAADVLARVGARVITVESVRRPDGARTTPRFFDSLHSECEFVALELDRPAGHRQLARLVERADVVIESSRPRALEQMGIDARAVLCGRPRIWVSITAHGHRYPQRVGFGDDAAVAGGLFGWVDTTPVFVADAVADPLTGLLAAASVADLCAMGGRWYLDLALSRAARSCAGGPWVPASYDPVQPRRREVSSEASPVLGRDTARLRRELALDRG